MSKTEEGPNRPDQADRRPPLPRSLRAALAALVVLLLVSVIAATYAVWRVNDSANRTYLRDVLPLQTAARGLVIGMLNEETGVRGNLITGKDSSLQPYDTGRTEVAKALATLRARGNGSPRLGQLVTRIAGQVHGLEDFYDQELALARSGGEGAAKARSNVEEGTVRFDAFRGSADALLTETGRLTREAQDRRDHNASVLVGSLLALAAAVAVLGAFLFIRVPRRMRAALEGQYQEAARASRFRDQAIALQRLAEALGEAETPNEAADTFTRLGIELIGGTTGAVWMLDETGEGLRIVATETWSDFRASWADVPVTVNAPVGTAIREDRPVYLGSQTEIEQQYPELADVRGQLAHHAWAAVPLTVGSHKSGVLVVTYDTPQAFSADQRALLAAVALRVAAALERSRLREARRRSLNEERILGALADALADASSRDQVRDALAAQLGLVGARAIAVALPGAAGESVDLVVSAGEPIDGIETPLADAMRTRLEIVDDQEGGATRLFVPVGDGRRVAGGVALELDRTIEPVEQPLLRRFAARCLAAVERAMLIEAEQAARLTAERLRRISQRLSTALAAADVAAVIVDEVGAAMAAHGVAVATLDEGFRVRRLAVRGGSAQLFRDEPISEAIRRRRPVATGGMLAVPLVVRGEVVGGLVVERDDADAIPPDQLALFEAIAGQCGQALQRALLYDGEHEARTQSQLLERHAAHVAAAATERAVAEATVTDLEDVGVDTAGIYALRDGEIELLAVRGVAADVADRHRILPLDADTPAADSIRRAQMLDFPSRDEIVARYPAIAEVVAELGVESIAGLPLRTADGRINGSLLISSATPAWLDVARRRVLAGIAEQCGVALERAALLERERAARLRAEALEQRAMRLQELTALLAAATDVATVARIVVRDFVEAVGGMAGSVFLLDDASGMLRLVDRYGAPGASISGREIAVDAPVPGAQAIRMGSPVLLGDPVIAQARFPAAADAVRVAERPELGRAWAHLPLTAAIRPIGILVIAYADPQPFDAVQQAHLLAAAAAAGQALQRAALIESDRLARESSEALAQISSELAETSGQQAQLERIVELLTENLFDAAAVVVEGHPLRAAGRLSESLLTGLADDPGLLAAVVSGSRRDPLPVDGGRMQVLVRSLGGERDTAAVLLLGRAVETPFRSTDLTLVDEITVRVSAALDRARLYDHEHEVSTRLQASLVSGQDTPPEALGTSQHYLAGHDRLHVGGDWTDIIVLDERRVALTVGDVVGRGIDAAAVMGRLRSALAAILLVSTTPGEAIDRLEVFAARVAGADYATIAVCIIDTGTGELTYSCAGHPPPLVVGQGEATYLWDARSAPLRAAAGAPRPTARTAYDAPFTVVLYTDGLVERRTRTLDRGLDALAAIAADRADRPLDDLRDAILATMQDGGDDLRDDSAVLLARLAHLDARVFARTIDADPTQLARLRRSLRSWLAERGAGDAAVNDVLLAVGEAAANAVEHAYAAGTGEITVQLSIDGERISGMVRDRGAWREPTDGDGRGRGLAIIRAVTESVEVDRREGGTAVMFECLLASEPEPS